MAGQYLIQSGRRALSVQDADRALTVFEDVSKQCFMGDDPDAAPAGSVRSAVRLLCDLSNALSLQGNLKEARNKAQDAWSLVSADAPGEQALVLSQFGILDARSRLYDDAERAFLDAIAIYSKLGPVMRETEARGWLADLYVRMERRAEARVQLGRISKHYGRTDDAESRSKASYFRACIAHLDERLGDAHAGFQSALERSDKEGGRPGLVCDLNLVGTAAFQTGNFKCAEDIFRAQLESNRDWRRTATEGVSQFYLGSIALEKNDAKAAMAYGRNAVEYLSNVKDAHQLYWAFGLMAEVCSAMGKADEAVKWADRARPGTRTAGETPIVAWRGIGVALAAANRHGEAEDAFERSITGNRTVQRFEWCRSLLAAGRFYLERGNPDLARMRLTSAARTATALQTPYYVRQASKLLAGLSLLEDRPGTAASPAHRLALDRVTAFSDLAADLGRGLELTQLVNRTVDICMEVVGAESAAVVLKDAAPGALRTVAVRSRGGESCASKAIVRDVTRRVIASNKPLFGAEAEVEMPFEKRQRVFDFGRRPVACIPLQCSESGAQGALYIDLCSTDRAISKADRRFLVALSGLLSVGVVQARMISRLEERTLYREPDPTGRKGLGGLFGASHLMQEVYSLIERAALTDLPVLIQGDTGTGKELAARAIHDNSAVKDRLFLSQNCGALSGELIHSELFGHKKGSFTGAASDRAGLFETATGGTVFLDEIADASPQVQASLLRVLQNGELRRLGESTPRRVNVRVIAASNTNLEKAVSRGAFRRDLFYRLQVLNINMPALRDRKDDIPPLAGHLLRRAACEAGKTMTGFTAGALKALMNCDWPGNVRQLDNEIRRAVALAENGGILDADLLSEGIRDKTVRIDESSGTLQAILQSVERRYLSQVLDRNDWNITQSALELGLTRSGLYKKLERHNLRRAG
ncbi:MAG: sigma 54-interacting transcriptional regulator [Gemmatimonadota bacterium]|nr:sigma 54-interacting transcriptional regulator [Gemmatimonadota bacterium]